VSEFSDNSFRSAGTRPSIDAWRISIDDGDMIIYYILIYLNLINLLFAGDQVAIKCADANCIFYANSGLGSGLYCSEHHHHHEIAQNIQLDEALPDNDLSASTDRLDVSGVFINVLAGIRALGDGIRPLTTTSALAKTLLLTLLYK